MLVTLVLFWWALAFRIAAASVVVAVNVAENDAIALTIIVLAMSWEAVDYILESTDVR